MQLACGNLRNVFPFAGIFLFIGVGTAGNHRTIRLQSIGILAAGCYRHNILPVFHIQLTTLIVAYRHNRTIGFQSQRMLVAGSNILDVFPSGNIALSAFIFTRSDHRSVRFQAHRMVIGADCRDIFPAADFAAAILYPAHCRNGSVIIHIDTVIFTGSKPSPVKCPGHNGDLD